MGAMWNNGIGITGVVNGETVCWIIARVFQSVNDKAIMSDILEGVEWVVEKGARVVNLSLGGGGFSQAHDAFFQDLYDKGVVVVAAAGNDGTSEYVYPASYQTVLSVGAVTSSNGPASFSNFNSAVNVCARTYSQNVKQWKYCCFSILRFLSRFLPLPCRNYSA